MDTPPSLHSTVMMPSSLQYGLTHKLRWQDKVQVNLCQKLLFLHQLTHNMTTYCSLNYKFNTWKFQAQNMGRTCCVQKLILTFRTIYVHNMFSPCSTKIRSLTKIYLYRQEIRAQSGYIATWSLLPGYYSIWWKLQTQI